MSRRHATPRLLRRRQRALPPAGVRRCPRRVACRRVLASHAQPARSSLTHALCHAGCGPDLLWYELPSGDLRCTAQLFAGARVHGLRAAGERGLVAHGGRRVATYALERTGDGAQAVRLAAALPSFAAWVLDVRPLRGDDEPPEATLPPTLLAGAATTYCRRCCLQAR